MKLTEHFSLEEMTRSATAERHGLKNEPSKEELENLVFLCENVLEPLRLIFGHPIKVTSGYRSKLVNERVGGSKTSQHMSGLACDIAPADGASIIDLFWAAKRHCTYDQLLLEYNKGDLQLRCLHISTRRPVKKNRMQSSRRFLL